MTTVVDVFIEEGMKKYKQASAVMLIFQNSMEERLQKILKNRSLSSWGQFSPGNIPPMGPGRTWKEYPTAMATIEGVYKESELKIGIIVDWYSGIDNEYPFYGIWIDPRKTYLQSINEFEWQQGVVVHDWGIKINPDGNDFNLERDFGLLLDEIVRFLDSFQE